MSEIKAFGSLSGKLSGIPGLYGKLSVLSQNDPYLGDYNVVPKADNALTLETAHKFLNENIIVAAVPYFETDNASNGITAYIAKEI